MNLPENSNDFIHPELLPGEVFFSNMSRIYFDQYPNSTKRLGNIAYDGRGNRLGHSGYFPVFISSSEARTYEGLRRLRNEFHTSYKN